MAASASGAPAKNWPIAQTEVGGGGGGIPHGVGGEIKMIPSGLTSVPLNLHPEVQVLILDYNQV